MSEIQAAEPVVETNAVPVTPDFGAMESIAEYQKVRDGIGADTPAEPVEAKAEEPVTEPDPASEAGKALAGKKRSLQARIDEITREKHDTARERDAAKAEAAAMRAELAALKAGKPAADPSPAQPTADTPQSLTKPVRPKQSDYEDFEQYEAARDEWVEKLAEFKAEEKIAAERSSSQAQAVIRAQHAALYRVYEQGREAHADFDAMLEQQANAGIRWSPLVTDTVLSREDGHLIAYALAKDPEAAQRLSGIQNVAAAALEMGLFIARLSDANAGPSAVVAPVTTAPDPIKPVGGSSSGASTADPKDINSIAAWRARRKDFL